MGVHLLTVTFFGVRGSTPSPCAVNRRYGGNTACVVVEAPGADPIIFDMGTGLRSFGETVPADTPFHGTALVTHLHWDHIQGLPFFSPILRAGSTLDVYGPTDNGLGLTEAFNQFMGPPYFPICVSDLPGKVSFHDAIAGSFAIGDAKVTVRPVPHVGATNGYRVESGGATVVYISDHQQPGVGNMQVDPAVVELCSSADLLIHDAQYRAEDFAAKATWGHCTVEYAVAVAASAGVRRLALFHHDPAHDDEELESMLILAQDVARGTCVEEVLIGAEGMSIVMGQTSSKPPKPVSAVATHPVGV